jgi:hypothetical protein
VLVSEFKMSMDKDGESVGNVEVEVLSVEFDGVEGEVANGCELV